LSGRYVYPFTAIVGQERMRLALLLHAVNPRLGGVLIRGEKGTAKSTAVRALAGLLPSTRAIEGCPFGCDPDGSSELCESCAALVTIGRTPASIERPVNVVELPIGATEDRVLGSLDLERAIQSGERHFEPGLLARANRGILYVDEVNLLGDHLVDVLLDSAALGWNYVEREGVSFKHPASFMLVGTMNPEEGDLRPQLLDRFALTVEVSGLGDPAQRAEVVRRRIAFENDPAGFVAAQASAEEEERDRLRRARALLPSVVVPDSALDLIVRICTAFQVDGLRCDLAMYRTAAALAAYAGRTVVEAEDVRLAAELALPHRRRRQPFEQPGLDGDLLDQLLNGPAPEDNGETNGHESSEAGNGTGVTGDTGAGSPAPQPPKAPTTARAADRTIEPGLPLAMTLPRLDGRRRSTGAGRRAAHGRDRAGAPAGTALPLSGSFELALAATLRAAAPYQAARRRSATGPLLRLEPRDLREHVRQGKTSALVLFVVDASGSMGARQRMSYAKSATIGLLQDAYRRRDRVGVVAFRGDTAELLVPPTNSVELAERRLRWLPAGGRTPLARGLELAHHTIGRALDGGRSLSPMLVLVSDGKANVGLGDAGPWPAAIREAERLRDRGWPALVVDAGGNGGTGLSRAIATALGARMQEGPA
jgi:magnesium chelatase subunit D